MKLIGMLDSPYVRRVAISLDRLGVPFTHEAVSVFAGYARFALINPVVKAPTLVCDDGTVLMDSSLILQFIENVAPRDAHLWAFDRVERQAEFRTVGLALAACEKTLQVVLEQNLRPPETRYAPWLQRVGEQLAAAWAALECDLAARPAALSSSVNQAAITTAVAWQFTQTMLAGLVPAADHPAVAALSARMEQTPVFKKYPPVGVAA